MRCSATVPSSPSVPGGWELSDYQLNEEVVQLVTKVGSRFAASCSATLIGANTLVTAAHCVSGPLWVRLVRGGIRKFVALACQANSTVGDDDADVATVRELRAVIDSLKSARPNVAGAIAKLDSVIRTVEPKESRLHEFHSDLVLHRKALAEGADPSYTASLLDPIWRLAWEAARGVHASETPFDLALCQLQDSLLPGMKTACLPPKGHPFMKGGGNDRVIGFGCTGYRDGRPQYRSDPQWRLTGSFHDGREPGYQSEGVATLRAGDEPGVIVASWKRGDPSQAGACVRDSGGFVGFRNHAGAPLRITGVMSTGGSTEYLRDPKTKRILTDRAGTPFGEVERRVRPRHGRGEPRRRPGPRLARRGDSPIERRLRHPSLPADRRTSARADARV